MHRAETEDKSELALFSRHLSCSFKLKLNSDLHEAPCFCHDMNQKHVYGMKKSHRFRQKSTFNNSLENSKQGRRSHGFVTGSYNSCI